MQQKEKRKRLDCDLRSKKQQSNKNLPTQAAESKAGVTFVKKVCTGLCFA